MVDLSYISKMFPSFEDMMKFANEIENALKKEQKRCLTNLACL